MSKRSNKKTLEERLHYKYIGPDANRKPDLARDVIFLYTMGISHTAIQRILRIHNNKWIDEIAEQHFLGRKSYTTSGYGEYELSCEQRRLSRADLLKIEELAIQYETRDDDYVDHLIRTGECPSQKVIEQKMCPDCHTPWDETMDVCPKCGRRRTFVKTKNIFGELPEN